MRFLLSILFLAVSTTCVAQSNDRLTDAMDSIAGSLRAAEHERFLERVERESSASNQAYYYNMAVSLNQQLADITTKARFVFARWEESERGRKAAIASRSQAELKLSQVQRELLDLRRQLAAMADERDKAAKETEDVNNRFRRVLMTIAIELKEKDSRGCVEIFETIWEAHGGNKDDLAVEVTFPKELP